jgi:hypothetical protein
MISTNDSTGLGIACCLVKHYFGCHVAVTRFSITNGSLELFPQTDELGDELLPNRLIGRHLPLSDGDSE